MKSHEPYVKSISDYYVYTPTATAKKLFFFPICLGSFHYEDNYLLKRERYDSFLLMLITKGCCSITLASERFIASEGDIVLIDCYASHQYESIGEWEASWIHFDGILARDYYEQIISISGNKVMPRNLNVTTHALNKIINTFRNASSVAEASISKYITIILTELLLSKTSSNNAQDKKNSLTEIISYINEHFSEQISLDELAKRASLSPFYFTRLFTKQTGSSPHQYLIATRLNSAKFLLITTTLSIKEIAFQSGFSSEASFCSTFRKWENSTPTNYRRLGNL